MRRSRERVSEMLAYDLTAVVDGQTIARKLCDLPVCVATAP
jgi:hypothetical protein